MAKDEIIPWILVVGIVVGYFWLTWDNYKAPETQEEINTEARRTMECYVFSEVAIGKLPSRDLHRELSDIYKFYYDKYADEAGWSRQKRSSAERAYFSELKNKAEFGVARTLCYSYFKFLDGFR